MAEDKKWLKSFEQFGLQFPKTAPDGLNFPTFCPFSEKENKLVVHKDTGMWHSFTTDKKGNLYSFMEQYYDFRLKQTKLSQLSELATDRKIPIQAFSGIALNPLNGSYMVPCRNSEGAMINIGHYCIGRAIYRTAGANVGIQNIDLLKSNKASAIYLCEGEWDMYALQWALGAIGKTGIVMAVPGALTFKESWLLPFKNRKVLVCYDNDQAGYDGQQKVAAMLRPMAEEVQFLYWPELTRDKYDVRDFIIEHGGGPKFSKAALNKAVGLLQNLFSIKTRYERDGKLSVPASSAPVDVPSREKLEEVYKKWLKMHNTDVLVVMYGACFANKIDGDPVWLFLVAPPGGSKTELLMTLSRSPFVETMTTLTPAALISGKKGSEEHSLLLKVNGRILIVKDFTTILTGNSMVRDEIFGILRDVFDGKVDKFFYGEKRSYSSKFGIVAGVTPVVDSYYTLTSSLGERFLKFRLDKTLIPGTEQERMIRALENVNHETAMKEELQDMGYRFLEKAMPAVLPTATQEQKKTIMGLALFCARLRGTVPKDRYTHEMTAMPVVEIGTRLVKQFLKLCIGMAIYLDKTEIDDYIMTLIKQVAIDTCPALIIHLVESVYLETKNYPTKTVTTKWISEQTKLPSGTISGLIAMLLPLNVLIRIKGEPRVEGRYRLHSELENQIVDFEIFGPAQAKEFVTKHRIRLKKNSNDENN
jgi:hypothetical protein